MKYHKIVIAGGNGYIGTVLAAHFKELSKEIVLLCRKPAKSLGDIKTVTWDGVAEGPWTKELENADLLVNLCGKNVNCRYTDKNQKEIIASRLAPTNLLQTVIDKLTHPPGLWINITSATIYRHAEDRPQDEFTGEFGEGFSVLVCKKWEQAFFEKASPQTRKIALRMGIVLGRGGGVLPRLLAMARCGLGGRQGNGNQYVSWLHEQDAARCVEWLIDQKNLEGIFNCTAPLPVKNTTLMHAICKACKIYFGLPTPAWLLKAGARLIGTETELILKSRWVIPARLQHAGFTFRFADINHALAHLLAKNK